MKTVPKFKLLYSIDDVVELTGISRTSIYVAIAAGQLQALKFGRRTVIAHDDLMAFIGTLESL